MTADPETGGTSVGGRQTADDIARRLAGPAPRDGNGHLIDGTTEEALAERGARLAAYVPSGTVELRYENPMDAVIAERRRVRGLSMRRSQEGEVNVHAPKQDEG